GRRPVPGICRGGARPGRRRGRGHPWCGRLAPLAVREGKSHRGAAGAGGRRHRSRRRLRGSRGLCPGGGIVVGGGRRARKRSRSPGGHQARRSQLPAHARRGPLAAGESGPEEMSTRIILDCDPGHDDALAIVLAHGTPEIDLVRSEPGEVTLVPPGPLTNVAMAIRKEPRLAGWVREVVLMGGACTRGNQTPAAEFTTHVDPQAAAIVFEAGWPVTMIGLEV